jgi:hypothetical protein
VKERVNQHHDPFTRHLPVEIASHIFSNYTEDFNSGFDPQSPIIEHGGSLCLGAVSESWRQVAFNTPHLWNTLNISIVSNDNLPMKVELTKQWLNRSRQLPLHLSLVYQVYHESDVIESEPNSLIPLFNVLQNVAPRWCKLVLGIFATLYTTFLREVTCAPTLETLKLFDNSSEEGDFRLSHTTVLNYVDVHADLLLSSVSIEWDNLTTFEANCVSMSEFFEVLRLVERLDSFRLRGLIGDTQEYALPSTPLTHSALRELYLETGDESEIADIHPSELKTILNLAVFPSLEKFGYGSGSRSFFPNDAPSICFQSLSLSTCPF